MAQSLSRFSRARIRWFVLALVLALASGVTAGLAQNPDTVSPPGEAVAAGPWQMTIVEVLTGGDAAAAAVGASAANPDPAEGMQYIAARVRVQNTTSQPFLIGPEDFAMVGASGVLRRFAGIAAPSPELDGVVPTGETLEG